MRSVLSLLVSSAVALGLAPLGGVASSPSGPTVLTVGGPTTSQPIAPGFLGLSFEYSALPAYAGSNPSAIDPVFVQLIRNLAGGNPPELRIGGDTTDTAWWPESGIARPAGVSYGLTRRSVAVAHALASLLGARLILGINLEADSAPVAAAEAKVLVTGIGRRRVEALELGNEPELYGLFNWGTSGTPGRPAVTTSLPSTTTSHESRGCCRTSRSRGRA